MEGEKIQLPTCSWNGDNKGFDYETAYYDVDGLKGMHLRTYHNKDDRTDRSKCILFTGKKEDKEIIVDMTQEKLYEIFVAKGIFAGKDQDYRGT